ncbi:restriction endonuclease [Streptomyces sp. NPDC048664]|uniref:Putative transmembrane restriction endonuclease n=1 Tax=Streptomyces sp. F2 TaxID=317660 RepID=V9Z215_9ACTN|nr:restriction endonuclease [Streptomyces sp. F2]AHE39580.1 Putative transmembrane restriction endonuclease [Streptomyces sp. F2]
MVEEKAHGGDGSEDGDAPAGLTQRTAVPDGGPDPDLLLDSPDPGRDPAGPEPWVSREELRGGVLIGAAVVALAAVVGFGLWLGAWLNEHWGIYAIVPQVVVMLLAVWGLAGDQRRRWEERRARGARIPLEKIDALHHRDFEFAVRDLMRRDGFDAERVGGAHDDGCDVRGVDADGRIWVVQCKHKRDGWEGKAIGVEVLQRLAGTAKTVHGAQFAVIITNGRFTLPAVERSETYGVHLIDRGRLELWSAEGRPLWKLLEGVKPARRLPGQRRQRRPGSAQAAAGVPASGRQGRPRAR